MAAPVSIAKFTDFPFGVTSFGMPVIGGGSIMTTGQVYFVDSTAPQAGNDTSHGFSPTAPFATLAYALGQTGAGRGDVIFVLPGHTESVISAAGLNFNNQGVRVVGLPEIGGRSRPTFTFAASVTASMVINANNCCVQGCIFDFTGIDALTAPILVKAQDFTIADSELLISSALGQVVDVFLTDSNASRMRIIHVYFNGSTDAGMNAAVSIVGTPDGIEIAYNRINGNFANAGIYITGAATNLYIHDNEINANGTDQYGINVVSGSATGLIARNTVMCTSLALALVNNMVAAILNNGYDTDAANAQAVAIPLVGTQLPVNSSLIDNIIGNDVGFLRANKVAVSVDFSSVTWNTVAKHEVFTVTGSVRVRIVAICTADLTSGGSATIQLGDEGATNSMIASTTATDIDTGEFWQSATPASVYAASSIVDKIITGGKDIGYEIVTAAMTAGTIVFYCYFTPLDATGTVVAGAGGVL